MCVYVFVHPRYTIDISPHIFTEGDSSSNLIKFHFVKTSIKAPRKLLATNKAAITASLLSLLSASVHRQLLGVIPAALRGVKR